MSDPPPVPPRSCPVCGGPGPIYAAYDRCLACSDRITAQRPKPTEAERRALIASYEGCYGGEFTGRYHGD